MRRRLMGSECKGRRILVLMILKMVERGGVDGVDVAYLERQYEGEGQGDRRGAEDAFTCPLTSCWFSFVKVLGWHQKTVSGLMESKRQGILVESSPTKGIKYGMCLTI